MTSSLWLRETTMSGPSRVALSLLVLCAPLSGGMSPCENARSQSECAGKVREGLKGIAAQPEKFTGLSQNSTYSDFQRYFHNAGLYNCSRPCFPQEEPCFRFGPTYPGMYLVMWARKALLHHPDWFPDLSTTASPKDIAKALYMRGHDRTPRVCEDGEEEGHFVPAENMCTNGGPKSHCTTEVVDAMLHGFSDDPSKFVGLNVTSTFSDFQAYFHNAGMHQCRRPCLPYEEPCVIFGPFYPGMGDVMWVRTHGMLEHPEWYPDLSATSSNKDIAKALYMRGTPSCKRVCEDGEEEGHYVPADSEFSPLSERWMQKAPHSAAYSTAPSSSSSHARIAIKKRKLPDQEVKSSHLKALLKMPWWTLVGLSFMTVGALGLVASAVTSPPSENETYTRVTGGHATVRGCAVTHNEEMVILRM
eukprot:s1840_g5.t1